MSVYEQITVLELWPVVSDGLAWNNAYLSHGGYARIRSFGGVSAESVFPPYYQRAEFSCQGVNRDKRELVCSVELKLVYRGRTG